MTRCHVGIELAVKKNTKYLPQKTWRVLLNTILINLLVINYIGNHISCDGETRIKL